MPQAQTQAHLPSFTPLLISILCSLIEVPFSRCVAPRYVKSDLVARRTSGTDDEVERLGWYKRAGAAATASDSLGTCKVPLMVSP